MINMQYIDYGKYSYHYHDNQPYQPALIGGLIL